MPSLPVSCFDLPHTLYCGQLFRVRQVGDWHYVTASDKLFRVRQRDDILDFDGADKAFLTHFLALDLPLPRILKAISRDPVTRAAVRRYQGLRLVRQNPWECLVSFLCSSASNIPKITRNVNALAATFGHELRLGDVKSHSFPPPGSLGNERELRALGLGFRAEFVAEANRRVTDGYLASLRRLPYAEAKRELMQLHGVGEKVADCVLLFSLGFWEAFPVDRWVRRVMSEAYFRGRKVSDAQIRAFAAHRFG
ncbi:MAG: 8-oxoguanine DNA glycosylase, partial [Planctomycetes bacterium]|nr:8-oxoguanine DNA glycosylase [Planctomycetota bacterium]